MSREYSEREVEAYEQQAYEHAMAEAGKYHEQEQAKIQALMVEEQAKYESALADRENAQWLRFAEAAMQCGFDISAPGKWSMAAVSAANFADAMLEEAKKRGKV